MNQDQALALFATAIQTALALSAPIVLAALLAGVLVGLAQAVTQVNEASISYIVKAIAVLGVMAAVGSTIGAHAVAYTRKSFEAVGSVTHP